MKLSGSIQKFVPGTYADFPSSYPPTDPKSHSTVYRIGRTSAQPIIPKNIRPGYGYSKSYDPPKVFDSSFFGRSDIHDSSITSEKQLMHQ